MSYVLALECIGDDTNGHAWLRHQAMRYLIGEEMAAFMTLPTRRPWVAQLTGLSARYGFERRFVLGKKDFSRANSLGSRGVYAHYILEEGLLYEVHALLSWKRSERYYCQIRLGAPFRLTKEVIIQCLSEGSASTS